jgi:secondary thiamine-phosphate synthase enzyme
MREFTVKTDARITMVDITQAVNDAVAESAARDGLCNIFIPHTTAAVIVTENWDTDVTSDMIRQLDRIVPRVSDYRHSEGNAQAHILSVMLSSSINVPIRGGKLALGRWQGLMLAEFDGPRERSIVVTVLSAK